MRAPVWVQGDLTAAVFETFADKSDTLVEQLASHEGALDLQDFFFKYTMV